MKIVIAPDSFKESLSASEVADAIELGFRCCFKQANFVKVPMADGGAGTLDCLLKAVNGKRETVQVTCPLGEKRPAHFALLPDKSAFIEIAQASGLHLVPLHKRDILNSSSFGSGELIKAALNEGAREFVIALGGSATCDGGMGALAALGLVFKDNQGNKLEPNALALQKISEIDSSNLDPRLAESRFLLAHDVENPLLGLEGALKYAPQKGAGPKEVELLHKGLENYAYVLEKTTHKGVNSLAGLGAAGGLTAGLYAFLNATLKPGAEVISDKIGLPDILKEADLVITGEGQLDDQSFYGKTPIAVAQLAKQFKLPVVAITGSLGEGFEAVYKQGIDAVFSIINKPLPIESALQFTKPMLIQTAYNIARLLHLRIPL